MAEVGTAFGAGDFGACHALGIVGMGDDVAADRIPKAGPSGAGVKFGGGFK